MFQIKMVPPMESSSERYKSQVSDMESGCIWRNLKVCPWRNKGDGKSDNRHHSLLNTSKVTLRSLTLPELQTAEAQLCWFMEVESFKPKWFYDDIGKFSLPWTLLLDCFLSNNVNDYGHI